jgi:hypothetical protein
MKLHRKKRNFNEIFKQMNQILHQKQFLVFQIFQYIYTYVDEDVDKE